MDLLEPFFHPLFDELLDDLEAGRTWTLSHVPEAIAKLNANMMDIAHLIPASFYQICELIEDLLPDEVRPACDSVIAHFFISCIHGVISKLIPVFRQVKKNSFFVAVQSRIYGLLKVSRDYDLKRAMRSLLELSLKPTSSSSKTDKGFWLTWLSISFLLEFLSLSLSLDVDAQEGETLVESRRVSRT